VALVLGFVGFTEYYGTLSAPRSPWDVFYLTLQLFVLESGSVSGSVPWELEVARLLAPAVAGYTAVRALGIVFREQFQEFRIRFLRNHVVICALGRKGFLLAQSLRERGDHVVVIEEDAENDLIETARGYKILVLIGDARDPQVLRNAGVPRASHLVAVSGDDGVNAEVAVRARDLVSGRRSSPLSCLVHIVDPHLCDLLRMQEIGGPNEESFRLDFINVFEGGARTLLDKYPPAATGRKGMPARKHTVVVGLGQFGESLVLQAARQWHAGNPDPVDKLRMTIVDQKAGMLTQSLSARYRWLPQVCHLEPIDMSFESQEFARGGFLRGTDARMDVASIFVCVDDDSHGISTALTLHRRVAGLRIPIIVRMAHGAGLASLLQEEQLAEGEFAGLRAFGLLDLMCSPDLLLAGAYEILAQAIHEEYGTLWGKWPETGHSFRSMALWEELPETQKESIRSHATQLGPNLANAGCVLSQLTDLDAEEFIFREDEIEPLAEKEHARWIEVWRRVAGVREDADPEPELDQAVSDISHEFVRVLPRILGKAGLQIVRPEAEAGFGSG
jgi:hypothetical protein